MNPPGLPPNGRMASTAGPRDSFIDAMRVLAVLVVVAGHWVTTTVVWDRSSIDVENALSAIPAAHPATWVLQVMPILFFVGGFANVRSLARHGGNDLAYLRTRMGRLLAPTLVFIVLWLAIGVAADILPIGDPNPLGRGADLAALPFWFLGLYVIVIALAPGLLRLHRRFGWRVPAALVVGALVVDLAVHGWGFEGAGVLNYGFVWLLPHQLGFFYADRSDSWRQRSSAAAMAALGFAGVVALVAVAHYPMSMVGVPGAERWNTDPPSLAIVALTFWLVGAVLLARPAVVAWASRMPSILARFNGAVLTMYLWHVSAIAVLGAVLYALDVELPAAGSSGWWATRVPWIAGLAIVLAVLVAVMKRFEIHPEPPDPEPHSPRRVRRVAASLAVVSLALGILGFGVSGFDRLVTPGSEAVLGVTANPMQNVGHVALGLVLLAAAYAPRSVPAVGAALGALSYVIIGVVAWVTPIDFLALNARGAVLHVAIGSVTMPALVAAAWLDRGDAPPGTTEAPSASTSADVPESQPVARRRSRPSSSRSSPNSNSV